MVPAAHPRIGKAPGSLASGAFIRYNFSSALDNPNNCEGGINMVDMQLPRILAGYAYPICPTCDKEYGPEVADVGPVKCDECGKWFEVTTRTVYHAEQMLDYAGKPADEKKSRSRSKRSEPKTKRAR